MFEYCKAVADFPSSIESTHGTQVASVLGGDYTQGQADGRSVGDPNWISGSHTALWEKQSSGVATESLFYLLGGVSKCGSCMADSYGVLTDAHPDVVNISHNGAGGNCTPASSMAYEDALENAYDDGIFVGVLVHNQSGPNANDCNVTSPSDTPKAFAVSGLGTNVPSCEFAYNSCFADSVASALGGGAITVNGVTRSAALVNVIGPARLRRTTVNDAAFPFGRVKEGYTGGNSLTAPLVSGAALVLKDFMLSDGHSFINSPGRLQAMMLGMTDSWHDESGFQASNGLDDLSGAGRLKMRLFDSSAGAGDRVTGPFRWKLKTYTFTSTGTSTFFMGPMSSGTEFAKCVLWEGEDMSGKWDMSDVWLAVNVRNSCSSSAPLAFGGSDPSYDIRHMVNLRTNSLAGKCLEVKLNRSHIANGGTTVNAFCYSAGEEDHEN